MVLVGEMRDPESIATTLTVAETGHLVFATLHTNDTSTALDRIIDVFPHVLGRRRSGCSWRRRSPAWWPSGSCPAPAAA